METKSKLVPVVDVDSIVYRCGYASDSSKDAEGNSIAEPLSYCLHSVKESLGRILNVFEPSEKARIFLQGGGNYRDTVATILPYKGNRDTSKRPTYYNEIREYLLDWHGAELVTGMETDDACGIEQWKHKDRSTCIVSIDKDLDCIPGYHYNYVTHEMYYVDLATANRKYWTQVLTGDSTDNILGCAKQLEKVYKSGAKKGTKYVARSGVGPKEAEAILARTDGSWNSLYAAVLHEYEKLFGRDAPSVLRENATLLWIMREEWVNYDGSRLGIGKEESDKESVSTEGQE